MSQSREKAYAEIVGILAAGGINKSNVFAQLVTEYPEVFLEIHYCNYNSVTFDKDIPPTPEPEIRYMDRVVEVKVYPEELPDAIPYYHEDLPQWVKGVVMELLKDDKKIQAIKKVKDYTGAGLRESKDYVDRLRDRFAYVIEGRE